MNLKTNKKIPQAIIVFITSAIIVLISEPNLLAAGPWDPDADRWDDGMGQVSESTYWYYGIGTLIAFILIIYQLLKEYHNKKQAEPTQLILTILLGTPFLGGIIGAALMICEIPFLIIKAIIDKIL